MAANDLGWVDAVALRDLLADGEVTPAGVAEGAMARIEAANPALNAVVVPLPDIGRAIAADPALPRRAAAPARQARRRAIRRRIRHQQLTVNCHCGHC